MDEKIELIIRRAEEIYNEDSLREKLKSGKKLIIKLGADPSRPDLHLGHTVVLRALRLFQEMNHEVVFIIGDFTAMIGDPSGKSKTRPSLTYEETRKSGETYYKQVTKILDPSKTKVVYNSEWLNKLNFEDIIELTGKYTLARILERDDFKNRFEKNVPIGMHELLYPLIQGYDSVAIKADIEIGGTDQTFNLLVGRELQKDYGQVSQDVICFPLLVGLDGKNKMSKSLDNYIGIDESPEIMYEKSMKIPDDVLLDYFKLTTDIDLEKANDLIKNDIINAHQEYGKEIIRLYHGKEAIDNAVKRYEQVAHGGAPEDIEEIETKETNIINVVSIGFNISKSEARRLVTQGGIKINQEKITDINLEIQNNTVIQKGKNGFIKIIIK